MHQPVSAVCFGLVVIREHVYWHAECIAVRSAAGIAANDDYLAGDQQMKLAALMKVGFACISNGGGV
jgi:hypothetical protein